MSGINDGRKEDAHQSPCHDEERLNDLWTRLVDAFNQLTEKDNAERRTKHH